MSVNHGTVWWSELMTRDVESAMKFYADTCGWEFEKMPMEGGTYQVAMAHGQPVAGIMDMTDIDTLKDVPAHWFTYIAVDDVELSMDRTRFAGGEILREPFDVPDVGRIGIVKDAGGAAVGLMTPIIPDAAGGMADEDIDLDDDNFPV